MTPPDTPEIAGLVARLQAYVRDGDDFGASAKHPTTIAVRNDIEKAATALSSAQAEIERLRGVLFWYADQFCELGPYTEACGKLTGDDCSGCLARTALNGDRPHG